MNLYKLIASVFMMVCLINAACAAPNADLSNTVTTNPAVDQQATPVSQTTPTHNITWALEGTSAHKATGASASTIVTANSGPTYAVNSVVSNTAISNAVISNAVSFTPTSTSGTCIDNTKKIAVYMPAISNPMYMENTGSTVNIPVAFDPMTTAMLFEYNPDYLGDSSISGLNVANYGLLIVPTTEMSPQAETAISNYIASGGSVWFLNDPSMTPTYGSSIKLTSILGSGVSASIGSSTVAVVNTDPITVGLPASFVPVGTAAKTAEFRSLPAMSGTISGLNYQVLMGTNARAMLVKFENPTNGARVIYSNPNMFISGGTASYFNSVTATKLFMQTKAWIFKFAQNPNSVQVTYPNTDKQLTVTSDDEECTSWDVAITPMINAENALGIAPSSVNTFFITPTPDSLGSKLSYYAQYGDTHTLHPHLFDINNVWSNCDWENSAHSVATDVAYMTTLKSFINTMAGSTNYGFNSFRFPFTTYCANSMQAVSDSGFVIDSSSGVDSEPTGTKVDNTILLPKQTLVNNAKINTIEFELPAYFDINYATGSEFASAYNAYGNQFKNGNFPMNFVIGGHYQGMATNCGVSGWGVTSTGLTSGLSSILSTQKAANPNYATLNTLADYINGIKSAAITATYDGASTTTVSVTNSKPITGFTLKLGGTVNSVTCDGAALTPKTDSTTGAMYVTKDLPATAHTFVITTNAPVATKPTITFAPMTSTITSGASVNFVATVGGSPAPSVSWTFGDGAIGTGASVSHAFTNTGASAVTYPVVATATNSAGSTTFSGSVIVNPVVTNTKPTITVAPLTSTITAGSSVNFVATIGGTPAPTVSWNFGDGTAAGSGASVSHAFANTGTTVLTRTVTATATNSAGSTIATATVTVNPNTGANTKPTITITPTTSTITAGSSVTFTATIGGQPVPTVTWKFGDSTASATGTSVTHVFTNAGSTVLTRTVTATAKNSVGSASKTAKITVNPSGGATYTKPAAWFTRSATSGTTATTFTFTPDCDNNPTSFVWNFADGTPVVTTTTQTPVTHKFAKTGSFDVRLDVYNPAGTDYDDHVVKVK